MELNKEELSNILIHNYSELKQKVSMFDSLDTYNKKIVLLSTLFLLHLYISIKDASLIISEEHSKKIKYIFDKRNIKDECLLEFYLSINGPCSCLEYNMNSSIIKVPTKSEYLFRDIEKIDINDLKMIMLNSSNSKCMNNAIIENNKKTYKLLLDDIQNDEAIKKRIKSNNT